MYEGMGFGLDYWWRPIAWWHHFISLATLDIEDGGGGSGSGGASSSKQFSSSIEQTSYSIFEDDDDETWVYLSLVDVLFHL